MEAFIRDLLQNYWRILFSLGAIAAALFLLSFVARIIMELGGENETD